MKYGCCDDEYAFNQETKQNQHQGRDACSDVKCVCWKVELTIPITQYISTVNMLTNFTWQKAMDPNCNCSPENFVLFFSVL